jgi:hypothetical protein
MIETERPFDPSSYLSFMEMQFDTTLRLGYLESTSIGDESADFMV